jgi:hypothetical protein
VISPVLQSDVGSQVYVSMPWNRRDPVAELDNSAGEGAS